MSFQNQIREFNAGGFPGEINRQAPSRVTTWNLDSSVTTNPNPLGYAFGTSASALEPRTVRIGYSPPGFVFAGIAIGAKEMVLKPHTPAGAVTKSRPLDPHINVPNFTTVQLINKGIVTIYASTDGNAGDPVYAGNSIGNISFTGIGPVSVIPNAVLLENATADNFAAIRLY